MSQHCRANPCCGDVPCSGVPIPQHESGYPSYNKKEVPNILSGKPTAWLVKIFTETGMLADTRLEFVKPVYADNRKAEFVPLYETRTQAFPAYFGRPFKLLTDFREAASARKLPMRLLQELTADMRGTIKGPSSEDGRVAGNEIAAILTAFNVEVSEDERMWLQTFSTYCIKRVNGAELNRIFDKRNPT